MVENKQKWFLCNTDWGSYLYPILVQGSKNSKNTILVKSEEFSFTVLQSNKPLSIELLNQGLFSKIRYSCESEIQNLYEIHNGIYLIQCELHVYIFFQDTNLLRLVNTNNSDSREVKLFYTILTKIFNYISNF